MSTAIRTHCLLLVEELAALVEEKVSEVWFASVDDDEPDSDVDIIRETLLGELARFLLSGGDLTLDAAARFWNVQIEPHAESFIMFANE